LAFDVLVLLIIPTTRNTSFCILVCAKSRLLVLTQTITGEWAKGANFTISILFQVLKTILSNYNASLRPHTLQIQADNSWGENKNQWVLAFCAWLVKIGLFHEVVLSFLPVGHTHEDIDQFFSKISQAYMKANIPTPHAFTEFLRTQFPDIDIVWVTHVWDWQSWLNPFLHHLSYQSEPLAFHFSLNTVTSDVMMQSFPHHPILPQRNSGIVMLEQMPAQAPFRLQPKPIDPATILDTYHCANLFSQHSPMVHDLYRYHFEQISTPIPESDRYDPHLFDWCKRLALPARTSLIPPPTAPLRICASGMFCFVSCVKFNTIQGPYTLFQSHWEKILLYLSELTDHNGIWKVFFGLQK
jgi:hypothetical protein